jgi:hypothetical protein
MLKDTGLQKLQGHPRSVGLSLKFRTDLDVKRFLETNPSVSSVLLCPSGPSPAVLGPPPSLSRPLTLSVHTQRGCPFLCGPHPVPLHLLGWLFLRDLFQLTLL